MSLFQRYCSWQAISQRQTGIREREIMLLKVAISATFGVSAIICLVLSGLYIERYLNSLRINKSFTQRGYADFPSNEEVNAYDSCSVPEYTPDPDLNEEEAEQLSASSIKCSGGSCEKSSTMWTTVYEFNSFLLIT